MTEEDPARGAEEHDASGAHDAAEQAEAEVTAGSGPEGAAPPAAAAPSAAARAPQLASERVATIIGAAEQAAEDLRQLTERRARDRISPAHPARAHRAEAAAAQARGPGHTPRGTAGAERPHG